jgi:hypothetical protein
MQTEFCQADATVMHSAHGIRMGHHVLPFVYNQSNGRSNSMRKDISTTEIVRLYTKEKAAYRTIGTRLGVSVELVRGRLEKAGVSSRSAGEGNHHNYAE